jgi:hypothetical protein
MSSDKQHIEDKHIEKITSIVKKYFTDKVTLNVKINEYMFKEYIFSIECSNKTFNDINYIQFTITYVNDSNKQNNIYINNVNAPCNEMNGKKQLKNILNIANDLFIQIITLKDDSKLQF